jgi:hypothetical protein
VKDNEALQGESLEDGTREANTNLRRLLEAIGGILAASGDLLVRLQQILGGAKPAAGTNGSDKPGTPRLPDRNDG